MTKIIAAVAALVLSGAAFAQVGTAVKETAKGVGQTAAQAGDNTKAVVSPEPTKSVEKAKARVH